MIVRKAMKRAGVAFAVVVVVAWVIGCENPTGTDAQGGNGGGPSGTAVTADLVLTLNDAAGDSYYNAAVTDAAGNIYVAGVQSTTGEFEYGTGVVSQGSSNAQNAVVVKYNSDGTAQWARTVSGSTARSEFLSVDLDANGNVYVSGYQRGSSTFEYGNGVTATANTGDENAIVVKYNPDGDTQWARTVDVEEEDFVGNGSRFFSVAVDDNGNVIVVGEKENAKSYTFSEGDEEEVKISGVYYYSVVIVKYNTDGVPQWANTINSTNWSSGNEPRSAFYGVVVDSDGNAYAAGFQRRADEYRYGNGVVAEGPHLGSHAVLVKYNSDGDAQWARIIEDSSSHSRYYAIAIDGSDNLYTAGYLMGEEDYLFGDGVSTSGANDAQRSALLVSYDSDGTARWATSTTAAENRSEFNAVTMLGDDRVAVAGYQRGDQPYGFGNSVSTAGAVQDGADNALIVVYGSSGTAQTAQSVKEGTADSQFKGVAAVGDNLFTVGYQQGDEAYVYGSDASATGPFVGDNAVIVRY